MPYQQHSLLLSPVNTDNLNTLTHLHTQPFTGTYTYTHTNVHMNTDLHTHTCSHAHTLTHTRSHAHTLTHTHSFTCTQTYTHINTHTHTYTLSPSLQIHAQPVMGWQKRDSRRKLQIGTQNRRSGFSVFDLKE